MYNIVHIQVIYVYIYTRDINDAELLMPSRDFHFRKKYEPMPSRDSSQTSPSRTETLAKRAQAESSL